MRRIGKGFVLLTLLLICCANFDRSFAEEKINSIDITMEIQNDGSAKVQQVWDIVTGNGTEFYIPMSNMGDMEVKDFRVTDENGRVFTFVKNWDIGASLEQKAYKNGFHPTDEGFEMCWGKGSYGAHTYTLEYTLTNLVKSYPDYDGFLTRLVNAGMDPTVQSASVKITRAGVPENESFAVDEVGIWAFGYSGVILQEDGYIFAKPDGELDYSNHITILVRLPKGLIQPTSVGEGTFEELETMAKRGSGYENSNQDGILEDHEAEVVEWDSPRMGAFGIIPSIFFGGISFLLFGVFFIGIIFIFRNIGGGLKKQYLEMGGNPKAVNYYREIPFEGSMPCIAFSLELAGQAVSTKDILSAYALYLVKNKALRSGEEDLEGGEKKNFHIRPSEALQDPFAARFLEFIEKASGMSGEFQEKEMKRWARKHYKEIDGWIEEFRNRGKFEFSNLGGTKIDHSQNRPKTILTEKGVRMIDQAVGFKKFLNDLALFSEGETGEVELWDDYLIFAALFGITDQVAREAERMQPNFVQQSLLYHGRIDFLTMLHLSHVMNSSYQSAKGGTGSAVGGSFSSVGGGGGFSGGGMGGGSR